MIIREIGACDLLLISSPSIHCNRLNIIRIKFTMAVSWSDPRAVVTLCGHAFTAYLFIVSVQTVQSIRHLVRRARMIKFIPRVEVETG